MRQPSAAAASKCRYVPSSEVDGNGLRLFSVRPIITGPHVCQLCDPDALTAKDFALHKQGRHAGEAEYRKRALYLMAEAGCRPITAQEKRPIVQNVVNSQQSCDPGS